MTRTARAPALLVEAFRDHVDAPEAIAQAFCDAVEAKLVAGKKVNLGPLGTFMVSTRRAFQCVNPKNGEVVDIHAAHIPIFRVGGGLRHALGNASPSATKGRYSVLKGIPKAQWPAMVDTLTTHLAARLLDGTPVEFGTLGRFSLAVRKAFTAHNPKTGAPMQVPGASLAVFRASPALKRALNPHDEQPGEVSHATR